MCFRYFGVIFEKFIRVGNRRASWWYRNTLSPLHRWDWIHYSFSDVCIALCEWSHNSSHGEKMYRQGIQKALFMTVSPTRGREDYSSYYYLLISVSKLRELLSMNVRTVHVFGWLRLKIDIVRCILSTNFLHHTNASFSCVHRKKFSLIVRLAGSWFLSLVYSSLNINL